jgi:hypothetical protein
LVAVSASSWLWLSGATKVGGGRFAESEDAPKTRFRGLLGDARVRVKGLAVKGRGLPDRTDSFTPVLKGVKAVVCGVVEEGPGWLDPGVLKFAVEFWANVGNTRGEVGVGDDCGVVDGEPSAEAEEPGVVRAIPKRDGDLDMERRRDRTAAFMSAAFMSTWWT